MNNTFKKIYAIVLVAAALVAITLNKGTIFGFYYFSKAESEVKVVEAKLDNIRNVFPDAERFIIEESLYVIYNKLDKEIGYALNSSPYSDSIRGYGGKVPVIIGFDNQMKVVGVAMLHNNETPEYLNSLERKGYFSGWNSLTATQALSAEVDGLSGATITSYAISNTVKHRLTVYANKRVDLNESDRMFSLKNVAILILIVFALMHYFYPAKLKRTRIILHILNVAVLGFWFATMLSLSKIYNLAVIGPSSYHDFIILTILALAVFLPSFKNKDFYCSHMCPFGSCQQLIHNMNKGKARPLGKFNRYFEYIRTAYLIIIAVLLISELYINLALTEPFTIFNFQTASPYVILAGMVLLVLSFYYPRIWCRLCPTGKLITILKSGNRKKISTK